MVPNHIIEQFKTVKQINIELKRIAPRKKEHRIWSYWGNVESKERYQRILRYEKQLKELKEQLKNKNNGSNISNN